MHDLSGAEVLVLLLASLVGGTIQGALGFGFALVVVPVLALLEPDGVPVVVLVMAIPVTAIMSLRERRAIDVGGFAWIMGGRVAGIAAGVVLLLVVAPASLSAVVGGMILLGVALSVAGLDIQPARWINAGAGVLSGLMGTTSAIGGPALAVVYQRRPGPELRSTLALSYLVGLGLSLGALTAVGRVQGWHVLTALQLMPGLLLGLWLSFRVTRIVDRGWLRPAVLAFAAVAGTVIVLRALA